MKIRGYFLCLISVLVLFFASCTNENNPNLATFTGGVVKQDACLETFLEGVRGNPNYEPTEVLFKKIISDHAMKSIGVQAALDTKIQETDAYAIAIQRDIDTILLNKFIQDKFIDVLLPDSVLHQIHASSSPQYKMSIIKRAIKPSSPEAVVSKQQTKIDEIYQQLQNGASFQILAKKYSEEKSVQYNGGDIGFMFAEAFSEPVLRAVMDTLKVNAFSEPVRGLFGFYILQKGKGINIDVPPYSQVKNDIFKIAQRSRQYEIKDMAQTFFDEITPKYNYIRQEENIGRMTNKIIQSRFMKQVEKGSSTGNEHLTWVLALYEADSITVKDVFTESAQFPQNLDEFLEQFQNVAQNRVFALEARSQGYLEHPELKERIKQTREQTLRTLLYKRDVLDKASALFEEQKLEANHDELKNMSDFVKELRSNFEEKLKEQYNYRVDPRVLAETIALAQKQKDDYLKQNKNEAKLQ